MMSALNCEKRQFGRKGRGRPSPCYSESASEAHREERSPERFPIEDELPEYPNVKAVYLFKFEDAVAQAAGHGRCLRRRRGAARAAER